MSIQKLPEAGLQTARLVLQRASRKDVAGLLAYYIENRRHLQPWEPLRSDDFYTRDTLMRRLDGIEQQMVANNALHLLIRRPDSATLSEFDCIALVDELKIGHAAGSNTPRIMRAVVDLVLATAAHGEAADFWIRSKAFRVAGV